MNIKTLLGAALCTLGMAVTVATVSAVQPNLALQAMVRATEVNHCEGSILLGDLEYNAASYSNSAMSSGTHIVAAESYRIAPTIIAGSNCYGPASGKTVGLKLGGSSKTGTVTLEFGSSINVKQIIIYTNKKCTQASTAFTINDETYNCKTSNYNFDDVSGSNAKGLLTYNFDTTLSTDTIVITGKQLCIGYITIY